MNKSLHPDNSEVIEVDLFAAIEQGTVYVTFVAKDSTQATILFKNMTDDPIAIRLPKTFGAVPVVAQQGPGAGMGFGGPGMGAGAGNGLGNGLGNGTGGNRSQGVGGGFGNPMGGGGPGGNGAGVGNGRGNLGLPGGMGPGGMGRGGFFRVEPDKVRKLKVATVCLEHGKSEPNANIKYQLIALDRLNVSPETATVCERLGGGLITQNVAQAAAWHLANGLSWRELYNKPKVVSEYTGTEYYFSPAELNEAMAVARKAHSDNEPIDSSTAYRYTTSTRP